ncbi:glutathione-disulfide reductase [Pararobbsia silviterrae]|uniref:Glutathione-disulfide reductase n=1 Tax=Pararobbsia silviterrae TaxID=1792498 RepID=A0A494XZE7_9BURK|nr:glutathione-disulfide reductase [Pararobbsia silviterrae]RKP55902.1 glutathione-disulfide reductase [Pararobbsia silviterrae]
MAFDFDLFVIGAGSGGVRAARFSAGFGARVAIAESRYLGGTCVNVGCVPKKLLVYGAHYSEELAHAHAYGWSASAPEFDWPTLIAHKNAEIERLNGAYRSLLVKSGVTLIEGHAKLVDPHTVEINGQRHTAERILLATGTWPNVPDIPGKEHAITSNDAFFLDTLPRRAIVMGGGYIAVEFASIFNGLGVETTQLYRGELFLRGFDRSIREHLREELTKKGLDLRFRTTITGIDKQPDGSLRVTLDDGATLDTDLVMFATGRRPMLDDLGLENTRIALNDEGFIRVDAHYVTTEPSILALGDVIGRVQLTPVATAEGMAVARRLFRPSEYRPVDYHGIPTAVFSLPHIGTVGLTEDQAILAGHNITVYESRFGTLKLALTESNEKTFMRLIVDSDTDRVLGVHMVGADAGEIIQGMAVALKAGATKRVFDETIGIHPTSAEEFVTMRTPVNA